MSTGKLYDTSIILSRVFLTTHLLQVIYSQWIQQFALLVKVIMMLFGQQNAKQRAIVNMQLGPMLSLVMGKISTRGLRATHQQYQQVLEDDGDCQGM